MFSDLEVRGSYWSEITKCPVFRRCNSGCAALDNVTAGCPPLSAKGRTYPAKLVLQVKLDRLKRRKLTNANFDFDFSLAAIIPQQKRRRRSVDRLFLTDK